MGLLGLLAQPSGSAGPVIGLLIGQRCVPGQCCVRAQGFEDRGFHHLQVAEEAALLAALDAQRAADDRQGLVAQADEPPGRGDRPLRLQGGEQLDGGLVLGPYGQLLHVGEVARLQTEAALGFGHRRLHEGKRRLLQFPRRDSVSART